MAKPQKTEQKQVESKKAGTGSVIRQCNCENEFQDKTYGKNNRVHSITVKGYRCTVCSKIN